MIAAFCNSGRPDTRDPKVARRVLEENWRRNAKAVPGRALWVAVEVDEGDLVDEHAIAKKAVGPFRQIIGAGFREILIAGRGWKVVDERHIPAAGGITRQGPARMVHAVTLRRLFGRRTVTVVYGHFPTHAYNQPVVPDMRVQYDHMFKIMRQVTAWAASRNDVIVEVDANNQHFPQLHPQQVTLVEHAPDGIYGVPGPGNTITATRAWSLPMTIERSHQLRLVELTRTKEKNHV